MAPEKPGERPPDRPTADPPDHLASSWLTGRVIPHLYVLTAEIALAVLTRGPIMMGWGLGSVELKWILVPHGRYRIPPAQLGYYNTSPSPAFFYNAAWVPFF